MGLGQNMTAFIRFLAGLLFLESGSHIIHSVASLENVLMFRSDEACLVASSAFAFNRRWQHSRKITLALSLCFYLFQLSFVRPQN